MENTNGMHYQNTLIFDELWHAKSWEQYISEYAGSKIDIRKRYSLLVLLLSAIGTSTWGVWKAFDNTGMASYVPVVLFFLIGIIQVLSAVKTEVVLDERTQSKLHELRTMYINYYNRVERLYVDFRDGTIGIEESKRIFFEIRDTSCPIEELKDSLNIKSLKKLDKRVSDRMKIILKERWMD